MIIVDEKDYLSKPHEPFDLCNEEAIFFEVGTGFGSIAYKYFELYVLNISVKQQLYACTQKHENLRSVICDLSMPVPTAVTYT
jgi:hypothetical protein